MYINLDYYVKKVFFIYQNTHISSNPSYHLVCHVLSSGLSYFPPVTHVHPRTPVVFSDRLLSTLVLVSLYFSEYVLTPLSHLL